MQFALITDYGKLSNLYSLNKHPFLKGHSILSLQNYDTQKGWDFINDENEVFLMEV
jgi:hypothetical protein